MGWYPDKEPEKCTCDCKESPENQNEDIPCVFEVELGNNTKLCGCCDYCRYQCYLET